MTPERQKVLTQEHHRPYSCCQHLPERLVVYRLHCVPFCVVAVHCSAVDFSVACAPRSNHMEFDPEIAVRMVWRGVPVVNVETAVTYVSRAHGGVSHFRLFRDNFRISLMHSRLMTQMIMGRLFSWLIPALGRRARVTCLAEGSVLAEGTRIRRFRAA